MHIIPRFNNLNFPATFPALVHSLIFYVLIFITRGCLNNAIHFIETLNMFHKLQIARLPYNIAKKSSEKYQICRGFFLNPGFVTVVRQEAASA